MAGSVACRTVIASVAATGSAYAVRLDAVAHRDARPPFVVGHLSHGPICRSCRQPGYRDGVRAALLVCVALLAACSSQDSSEPAPAPSTPPTSSPPTNEATDPPDPPTTEPLVLAVHVRRTPADLTRAQAGLLVDGGVRRWSQLGLPGGRLTVTRNVQ